MNCPDTKPRQKLIRTRMMRKTSTNAKRDLLGCGICEGYDSDRFGADAVLFEEELHALFDYARLSGSRPCEDDHRPFRMFDSPIGIARFEGRNVRKWCG